MSSVSPNVYQLVFLGPPGCGKGTQASYLKKELNYRHIATGDLLRHEIANKTPLGLNVQSIMAEGRLVSDEIVIELLENHCDLAKGPYLFDGFPRTEVQAKMLQEKIIKDAAVLAIEFKIDTNILIERIVNRRTCSQCGTIYNIKFKPSKNQDKCDQCQSLLVQREDDKEDVVTKRIQVYNENMGPVLSYYKNLGLLRQVDASLLGDTVFESIKQMFE